MPVGICKLCLKEKELQDSHLIPRAAYKALRAKTGNPNPLTFGYRRAIQISAQIQDYLLCRDCERVLNRGGETWVLPLLATLDGFPLAEMLAGLAPEVRGPDFSTYSGSKVPEIQVDKLAHFALGIFWKAAVHRWHYLGKEVHIELGRHEEPVRRFLLGQQPFPKALSLMLCVTPTDLPSLASVPPDEWSDEKGPDLLASFFLRGILFMLCGGSAATSEMRSDCFVQNPAHPIVVAPHGTMLAAIIMRRQNEDATGDK